MPTANHERRQVIYRGRVQGVGFRFTCRHIAQGYAVTGFVQNLDDGTVKLAAEGEPAELDRFLAAIAERMGPNIRRADVSCGAATSQFSSFEIVG